VFIQCFVYCLYVAGMIPLVYMKQVTIYTTPTCVYCKMTKDFFQKNNVQYTEHNVAADAAKRDEMIDKSSQMGVPVIDIDGEIIIGFDQKKLSQLLDIKS